MRKREAARSRELAAQRHLLRLWRPPLGPGEWRTLGLFAARDDKELEQVLTSMPLRVWRTDEVMAFASHPNDPQPRTGDGRTGDADANAIEFFTTFTIDIPQGTPDRVVQDTKAREAQRARELAERGHLLRLWIPAAEPHGTRSFGLWRAHDAAAMQTLMESLPLYAWMRVHTTPLTQHPNDPALS